MTLGLLNMINKLLLLLCFLFIYINNPLNSQEIINQKSLRSQKKKDNPPFSKQNIPPPPKMTHPEDSIEEWLNDVDTICHRHFVIFGEYPDLFAPRNFSEKIIYKQIYDRRPILTDLADKIKVREFVKDRIGDEYLNEIYQIHKNPDDFDWSTLPNEFVLKPNHGSGWTIFVKDKISHDIEKSISTLKNWLNINYYYQHQEWCYKHIERSVFAEKLLLDEEGKIPTDWKIFVFQGKAKYLQVNINRHENNQCNMYDRNLQKLNLRYNCDNFTTELIFPENIEEMFLLAEKLGEGFDFIRADFYNIGGKIYFGEITHYPNAALPRFKPHSFDILFGHSWVLPKHY